MQQNTSLELAKAIRELEESTKALNSAYDTTDGGDAAAIDTTDTASVSSSSVCVVPQASTNGVCGSGRALLAGRCRATCVLLSRYSIITTLREQSNLY